MPGNGYRVNINMVRRHHSIVVHRIAQVALFFYGLMGQGGSGSRNLFAVSRRNRMLVRVYDVLARSKANQ
jgi:hypothetical protein